MLTSQKTALARAVLGPDRQIDECSEDVARSIKQRVQTAPVDRFINHRSWCEMRRHRLVEPEKETEELVAGHVGSSCHELSVPPLAGDKTVDTATIGSIGHRSMGLVSIHE